MTKQDVREEIKLELTGGLLELEIDDSQIDLLIDKGLRELQRYWDEPSFITVHYKSCIDLKELGLDNIISSVVKVYRTVGVGNSETSATNSLTMDPMYAQQWMIFSNAGTMYNVQDYVMNLAAWTTLSQVRNTVSTDMAFREDRHNHKIYVNNGMSGNSGALTIEFIPKINSVEDIKSDYWQDVLVRICLNLTKIALGRIRTRFTQSNALWAQDGEKLLEEGTTDLKELREVLRVNSQLIYPID